MKRANQRQFDSSAAGAVEIRHLDHAHTAFDESLEDLAEAPEKIQKVFQDVRG